MNDIGQQQQDLFDGRATRYHQLECALEQVDVDQAAELFPALLSAGVRDPELLRLGDEEQGLLSRLRGLPQDAQALLQAGRELLHASHPLERAAGRGVLRSLLAEADGRRGRAKEICGMPAGELLLLCADSAPVGARSGWAAEATTQLEQALVHRPDWARAHWCLGDALFFSGRAEEALEHYRLALETDWREADLEQVRHPTMQRLRDLVAEHDLDEQPRSWALAVGLVEGLFTPPTIDEGWEELAACPLSLIGSERFVQCLLVVLAAGRAGMRDDRRVLRAKREMRRLVPELYERFKQRFSSA